MKRKSLKSRLFSKAQNFKLLKTTKCFDLFKIFKIKFYLDFIDMKQFLIFNFQMILKHEILTFFCVLFQKLFDSFEKP